MTAALKGTQWPQSELDTLLRLYPGPGGMRAVALELPHRTPNAIHQRARRLGLKSGAPQGQASGTYLGSVRSLETLRGRCIVDDERGCWHLRSPRGKAMPTVGHVHQVYVYGKGKISAVRAAWMLSGKSPKPAPGLIVYRTCESYDCVNPAHLRCGTYRAWGEYLAASGKLRTAELASRRGTNKRHLRKLTSEQAQMARTSELSAIKVAAELGVSKTIINAIRAGVTYRDALPGSSVFSWRPA